MNKAKALRDAQNSLRDMSFDEAEGLMRARREQLELAGRRERLQKIDLATARFNLKDLAAAHEGKPFAHPFWWGAFQCVGAG